MADRNFPWTLIKLWLNNFLQTNFVENRIGWHKYILSQSVNKINEVIFSLGLYTIAYVSRKLYDLEFVADERVILRNICKIKLTSILQFIMIMSSLKHLIFSTLRICDVSHLCCCEQHVCICYVYLVRTPG